MDEHAVVDVVFEATGPDERIKGLGELTNSPIWNPHRDVGDGCDYVGLTIASAAIDLSSAVEQTIHWLELNRPLLAELDARLTVEFQSRIGDPIGCKIAAFPDDLIFVLAELGCNLHHMVTRVIE